MPIRTLLALTASLILAAPAAAAPVSGNFTLSISILGTGLPTVTVGGAGTIDVTGGIVTVPFGLVFGSGLVVPATATTSIDSVSVLHLTNLTGTFSIGGITAQAPGEVCPGGFAPAGPLGGLACNVGGSLGGLMGLTGSIAVNVIPGIVVVPLQFGGNLGLGGATNVPYSFDAAGWTTGIGLVNTGPATLSAQGTNSANGFQLVSPLFVAACGNVLPIFASFTASSLSAVPEPAAWALVWFGLLGLVVVTRRR